MKTLFFIILCALPFSAVFSQNAKQQSFETAVKEIVTAFKTKNIKPVKKYIDAQMGLYTIYRPGVFDQYGKMEKPEFGEGMPNAVLSARHIVYTAIQYRKLPSYSCDADKWARYGIFCDTVKISNALSDVCKSLNKYLYEEADQKIPAKEINKYIQWEKQSRRVVCCKKITGGGSEDLIIHLIWKNNRWYLWLIDKVLTDCSA